MVIKKFKPGQAIRDKVNRKNLIQIEPTEKNKVWATDITYISTQLVWCYLSTIMDRYTKKVIAWDFSKRMTVELVQKTLNKVIQSQNNPHDIILHSDQGSQYTIHEYEKLLNLYGITHSFSRKGYPYHNASLESWHGHLKRVNCQQITRQKNKGFFKHTLQIVLLQSLNKKIIPLFQRIFLCCFK